MAIDLAEDARRGEQAAALLNHPLLREAFDTIEREFTDAWKTSPSRDVEGRESLWWALKTLEKVQAHLMSVVNTGKMADVQLSRRGMK